MYESLSEQPYSMHFFLTFSKEIIRNAGNSSNEEETRNLEILRRTLKNIKDEDIEVYLHYQPEVALQIVKDLVDVPANQAVAAAS